MFSVMCLMALGTSAQEKYCTSYSDFKANNWVEIDTPLQSKARTQNQKFWNGGNDFQFTTGDKQMDKTLKNNALVVMMGDTMFVNCKNLEYKKRLFGKGYAKACRFDGNKILIVNNPPADVSIGIMFGLIGAAIAESNRLEKQMCYVLHSDPLPGKKRFPLVLIDDAFMEDLLNNYNAPELLEKYNQAPKNKRNYANNVLPILEELKLIE
jgi:hypothetical protein